MLFVHQSQRAVAAFVLSVLLALAAGGVCISFGAGVIPLFAPAQAATAVATQPEPSTRQNSLQEVGAAREPALPSSAGT